MSGERQPAILRHFSFDHLPEHLAAVSAPVADLATFMATHLTDGPELRAGLRKLLEAKDAFVRAANEADTPPGQPAGHDHGAAIR